MVIHAQKLDSIITNYLGYEFNHKKLWGDLLSLQISRGLIYDNKTKLNNNLPFFIWTFLQWFAQDLNMIQRIAQHIISQSKGRFIQVPGRHIKQIK